MSSEDYSFAGDLVAEFGTPLYVYDLDSVDARLGELRAFLPEGSSLYYSLKANPLPTVVAHLLRQGLKAEVSSPGELATALRFTSPERVLYTGPGKTAEELSQALAAGVRLFSCESVNDYDRIARAAGEAGKKAEVLVRINPRKSPSALLSMCGVPSQFGIEEEDLGRLFERVGATRSRVEVVGLHFYYGTQIQSLEALEWAFNSVVELSRGIAATHKLELRVLDMGGGFPWPFAKRGSFEELAAAESSLPQIAAAAGALGVSELCFESGRYLCASSGTLLTKVLDVKVSKGRKFVVTDAGINTLGGMSGLGRLTAPSLDLDVVAASAAGEAESVSVVGPLCSPLDYLSRNSTTPPLSPGDLVAVPNVGAYGATASLSNFLSRPPALEVTCRGGRVVGLHRLCNGYEEAPPRTLRRTRAGDS